MARCVFVGSFPACHAITASTANSGSVCSHARIASARPWEIRNCAASAPQAMTKAEKRILGNVQSADQEEGFGIIKRRAFYPCHPERSEGPGCVGGEEKDGISRISNFEFRMKNQESRIKNQESRIKTTLLLNSQFFIRNSKFEIQILSSERP